MNDDMEYVFSLKKNNVIAYQLPKKNKVVLVFPTLCKEWDLDENSFDKIVKLIDYYFLLERICFEIPGAEKWPQRYCRRFRHSRCRCEYVLKQCKSRGKTP